MTDPGILHILQHSLGVDQHGQGDRYRNHFVTGEGSLDFPFCIAAVAAGLMTRRAGSPLTGGDDLFRVTPAGEQFVTDHSPPPPKLTRSQQRYQDYLDSDTSLTFLEYVRWKTQRRAA